MKRLAIAALLLLASAGDVGAGGITPQGGTLTSIGAASGGGLTGGGTGGAVYLSLLSTCSSHQVLEFNGTWGCADNTSSTTLLASALTAGRIPLASAAHTLVDSQLSENAGLLSIAEGVSIATTNGTNSLNSVSTASSFAGSLTGLGGRTSGTFDTTAADANATGGNFVANASRGTGTHDVYNRAVIATASGGQHAVGSYCSATGGSIDSYCYYGFTGQFFQQDAASFASTLGVAGNFAVATSKFTVAAASGNTAIAGTLGLAGDFAIATSKFTVAAASGNTAIAGTLGVTGTSTLGLTTVGALTMPFGMNANGSLEDSDSILQLQLNHPSSGVSVGIATSPTASKLLVYGTSTGAVVQTNGASGPKWSAATGAPAGSCAIGDLFSRTDGSTSTTLYVCTATNTWTAK